MGSQKPLPKRASRQQSHELREAYAKRLPAKLDEISSLWQLFVEEKGKVSAESLATLHRMAHSLAGSGPTYGFTALGTAARSLETLLQSILDKGSRPTAAQQVTINTLLDALRRASIEYPAKLTTVLADSRSKSDEAQNGENRIIFLVEEKLNVADDLVVQLGYFGYDVHRFDSIVEARSALRERQPVGLIVDTTFPETAPQSAGLLDTGPSSFATIFISDRGDLSARLQAVRMGGTAYFTKPVDAGNIIDKLDQLSEQSKPEPFSILIVDDEVESANYHAEILRGVGMIATVVTDPLSVLAHLHEAKPDLVLVDMYMPGCSGPELAAVIHQQEAYVGLPIVYLSAETSFKRQLAALRMGDDFLTKPIEAGHLVSAVTSRAERLRILRRFMLRDSLTGLFNHTVVKEQLALEVGRARRHHSHFVFAFIDIDHFKSINDTYGHPVGDRVIKSLSRLLQQRLRRTDIIGRYGGDEFAVILPNADGFDAVKIFDELRAGFAQVRHQSDQHEFYSSFSCGISTFPDYEDPAQLTTAADRALYLAKQRGRNRVVLAGKAGTQPLDAVEATAETASPKQSGPKKRKPSAR